MEVLIIAIFVFILISAFCTIPFMLLWNFVMPAIFGLPTVNFWQAFAILAICNFLFNHSKSNKDK